MCIYVFQVDKKLKDEISPLIVGREYKELYLRLKKR